MPFMNCMLWVIIHPLCETLYYEFILLLRSTLASSINRSDTIPLAATETTLPDIGRDNSIMLGVSVISSQIILDLNRIGRFITRRLLHYIERTILGLCFSWEEICIPFDISVSEMFWKHTHLVSVELCLFSCLPNCEVRNGPFIRGIYLNFNLKRLLTLA